MKSALFLKHDYERGFESTVGDRALELERKASEDRGLERDQDIENEAAEKSFKSLFERVPEANQEMFGNITMVKVCLGALAGFRAEHGRRPRLISPPGCRERHLAYLQFLVDQDPESFESLPPNEPMSWLNAPEAVTKKFEQDMM